MLRRITRALLLLALAAGAAYALIRVYYTGEGCVTYSALWGPVSAGTPYYISLYVDSLEAFGKPFCTPEAFASGWGRLYYEILRVSSSGYEERVGDCLAQGETLGLYPNPYYSDEVYVYAENSCIVEPSYYTSFTLALYYD